MENVIAGKCSVCGIPTGKKNDGTFWQTCFEHRPNQSVGQPSPVFNTERQKLISRQACLNTAVEIVKLGAPDGDMKGKLIQNDTAIFMRVIGVAGKLEEWVNRT